MENEEKKVESADSIKTEKKSNAKYLIIGLVAVIVILVIVLGIVLGIVLFSNNKNNSDIKNNDIEEIATSEKNNSTQNSNVSAKGSSYEELIKNAEEDEKKVVSNLEAEFENLKRETGTYDKYIANKEKVKTFYDKIVAETDNFGIRLREYSLKYAELIMKEDISSDDKYDKLDDIYDEFYENIGDDIYNDIYDGIFDDMYDYYYDGILDDAYDTVPYSELSAASSNEYKWCSDARSDAYKSISNTRSDIYKFRSNMGSKLYQGKEDKALEEIEEFRQDIEKMKNGNTTVNNTEQITGTENKQEAVENVNTENKNTQTTTTNSNSEELRTDFKNAMDSYEKYVDEYIAFMKKYSENSTDVSLLTQYTSVLTKYQQAVKDFENWNSNDLNKAEQKYYIEVQTRVNKKLADAAIDMQ